jgi:hypothetical protein
MLVSTIIYQISRKGFALYATLWSGTQPLRIALNPEIHLLLYEIGVFVSQRTSSFQKGKE